MEIIDRLNSVYTIKFTEQYETLDRGDRKYYILNTFDDKQYLFKSYQKNTHTVTKLKDSNSVAHLVSKEMYLFCDYVISKDYDAITELDEDHIGTLYPYNQGAFFTPREIKKENFTHLAELSLDFHKVGYDLYENSFTVRQIEHVNTITKRNIEKIRDELNESGIHYLLDNKFGLKFDRDVLELNLSHVESINDRLRKSKSTILNMDLNFDNVTFKLNSGEKGEKDELHITNVIFDRVSTGHPYFEIGKTISRLLVHLKLQNTQDLKRTLLSEIDDPVYMQDQIIDSLACYYLIDMLYKFIKNERYREEGERFETLKMKLIKERVLNYI